MNRNSTRYRSVIPLHGKPSLTICQDTKRLSSRLSRTIATLLRACKLRYPLTQKAAALDLYSTRTLACLSKRYCLSYWTLSFIIMETISAISTGNIWSRSLNAERRRRFSFASWQHCLLGFALPTFLQALFLLKKMARKETHGNFRSLF